MAILRPLDPVEGRRVFEVQSPEDGRPIGELVCATPADVSAALVRARAAADAWAQVPISERVRRTYRLLDLIVERLEPMLARLKAETARPDLDTMMIELFAVCDILNYYAQRAPQILADQKLGLHYLKAQGKRSKIVYRPLGVIGVISPWNGPFVLSINPAIQAVLAGNAVLVKPSELTPDAGRLVGELFRDAGFPPDLVQILLGDGETGQALVQAGVDKIVFTGSVPTGKKVAMACAERLVPCVLELGGKDAMIVLADADVDRAARCTVFSAMMNTGQFCSATERVYVEAPVAEAFIQAVVANVKTFRLGVDYGPFIMARQCDIVEKHVAEAVAAGAKVLVGGKRHGNVYDPTVVVGVDHSMRIMRDETMGPVIPIMVVQNEAEALRLANDSAFGLSASIFTRDIARGERLARQMQTGAAVVNDMALTYGALELPFGGHRESGMGQVNGALGLRNYVRAFPIITEGFALVDTSSVWHPVKEGVVDGMKKALKIMFGTFIRRFL